jgi:hypothetical protein
MVWQIWNATWNVKEYSQFINEPKILTNPVRDMRLFESDFCEFFSKTPWYGVLLVHIPNMVILA